MSNAPVQQLTERDHIVTVLILSVAREIERQQALLAFEPHGLTAPDTVASSVSFDLEVGVLEFLEPSMVSPFRS